MPRRITPTFVGAVTSLKVSSQDTSQDTFQATRIVSTPPPSPSRPITRSVTARLLPPTDFHAIKALLTPFATLFDTVVSNVRIPIFSHIDLTLPTPESKLPYPLYTFHPIPLAFARGSAPFPSGTPTALQRGFQKIDLCDLAVHIMSPFMQSALQPIGARVDWLIVPAIPKYLVRYSFDEASLSYHSVCLIRSAAGEQYVADFTIEQFGYVPEMWFMKWSEYREGVCESAGRLADEEWVEYTEKISEGENLYVLKHTVSEACGCVGDKVFRGLGGKEREEYVVKCALEAVGFWDVDE